jgi:hypothetical protein
MRVLITRAAGVLAILALLSQPTTTGRTQARSLDSEPAAQDAAQQVVVGVADSCASVFAPEFQAAFDEYQVCQLDPDPAFDFCFYWWLTRINAITVEILACAGGAP